MTTSIVGAFARREDAQRALEALRNNGIAENQINAIFSGGEAAVGQAQEPSTAEKVGAAAGTGALALAGGVSFLIPFIGPLIAVGPLAAAMGVAASADAPRAEVMRQLEQALERIGLDQGRATAYTHHLAEGQSLVIADIPDDQTNAIADVFHRNGGSGLDFRQAE